MPIIHLLFALTIFVVIGYFVLLSSTRAEGRMRTFGKILAIWLFVLPVLALLAAAAHGGRYGGWRLLRHGPPPVHWQPPANPLPAPQLAPPAADTGAPSPAK
jgi:hypothetical protein